MNREKAINSQGVPSYINAVTSSDPKYQVRMFNGKPQFRIRKRNDSAKTGIVKYNGGRKTNGSFKEVQNSHTEEIDPEDDGIIGGYGDDSLSGSRKRLDGINNQQIISRLQSKYGIGAGIPTGNKPKKVKPGEALGFGKGIRKAYSNSNAPMQEPLVKMNSMSDKYSKMPIKKKFVNHNKLPEINQPKGMLPKIKS